MILTRTLAPVSRPITLDEVKAQVRVTGSDDDTLLTALIGAATDHLDGPTGILGRALITQTWTVDLEEWADPIRLPIEPVASLTIAYTNETGSTVTLVADQYEFVQPTGEPPLIYSKSDDGWPVLGDARFPVRITVIAGAASAPEDVKLAMLMLVAHWYEHREAVGATTMQDLPLAVGALLARHRRGLV